MRKFLAATILTAGLAAVACGDDDDDTSADSRASATARSTTTSTTVTKPPPSPTDFTIKVDIVEETCFGSAGCSVTYRITPAYVGFDGADRDDKYTVVYEVNGTDDGAQIGNFDVDFSTGDISYNPEARAQTPSANTELTATVTSILPSQ